MATVGLFYGSSTGNTEYVAYELKGLFDAAQPGLAEIFNIGSTTPEQFMSFDYLVLGIPTWNTGQLQDDWEFFLPKIAGMDMTGKKVAIFGLGDQNGYGFNFLDAIGLLAEELLEKNADICALWSTEGYQFNESLGEYEGMFLGVGLDEEGQKELTTPRLKKWVPQVLKEFALEAVPA
jgi:flavodoxin I